MKPWPAVCLLLACAAGAAEPVVPERLPLADAVALALERNPALLARRLDPAIAAAGVRAAQGTLTDPAVQAEVATSRGEDALGRRADNDHASAAIAQPLPTGTVLSAGANVDRSRPEGSPDASRVRLEAGVTQQLLRGARLPVNRIGVALARIDLDLSRHELVAVVQALVQEVEDGYWRLALAQRRVAIVDDALAVAEAQAREVRERIALGRVAASERHAADATVAARRADGIDARAALASARLRLLRLLDLPAGGAGVEPVDDPAVPAAADAVVEVSAHVAAGLLTRPDLAQAELEQRRGRLRVVQTRDGLLPRLELFASIGRSAYAETLSSAASGDGDTRRDWSIGLRLDHVLGNRVADASAEQARIGARQAEFALVNQRRLAETEVREAHLEVERARSQIDATAARVAAQEEVLRAAREGLAVGRRTSLEVDIAARDLLEARLDQARAQIAWRQALTALHRADGSLLVRRGVVVPEAEPRR